MDAMMDAMRWGLICVGVVRLENEVEAESFLPSLGGWSLGEVRVSELWRSCSRVWRPLSACAFGERQQRNLYSLHEPACGGCSSFQVLDLSQIKGFRNEGLQVRRTEILNA